MSLVFSLGKKASPGLTSDQRVLFEVAWQHQTKEDGET